MRVAISGILILLEVEVVQFRQIVQEAAARFAGVAGRIGKIQHRVAAGAELHALIFGGQKAAAPLPIGQRLRIAGALRDHHHEGRQILVLAAQAIGDPRADAGAAGDLKAGLEKCHRGIVIDGVGLQRADDRDAVGDLRRVGQHLAQPRARLRRAART